MANLYKCSICGKVVKRYNKGTKNFICCNTRQPVTDDNWINKPKNNPVVSPAGLNSEGALSKKEVGTAENISPATLETQDDKSRESMAENGKKNAIEKSMSEPESNINADSEQNEVPRHQESSQGSETPKAEDVSNDLPIDEIEDKIVNKCGECGAVVDDDMICHNCGIDYNE